MEDEKKVKGWLTACIADYGKSYNKAEIVNLIYDNLVYLGYEEGPYRDDDISFYKMRTKQVGE